MLGVVPSVIKGHVLHLLLLQRKSPGVLGGWSAVFGSDKVFVHVIATAVGYKRRRRKFFFASL